jgi:sterol desaturase/sphingolipid hydroxylase (fatty acid hydroxylase superfamily)
MMPYATYLYAATIVVLFLEIVAGRHRGLYDRHTWAVTLGCIVGSVIARPLSAIVIAWAVALALPSGRDMLAGTPLPLAFLAVFVTTEFTFYWGHRWAHEAKKNRHDWFWKLHRTHHSAEFLNVGVTIRINPFWSFVVPTSWVLGIATYLGLGKAAGLTLVVIYGWNLITHAHFRWDDPIRRHRWLGRPFRALEHVLVSPGIHHSHHGYGRDGGNFRNYAVTLSLFDWMFGTLHIPDGRPWRYGIPGGRAHWAEEVLYPIVWIRREG